jgi:hypothetical protein
MVQWGDAAAATACRRTGRHGHEEGLSVSPQKMAAEEAKLFFCSLTLLILMKHFQYYQIGVDFFILLMLF